MNTHQFWMKQALAEAQKALPLDVPVGALVLDSVGEVLAIAHNQRELNNSPSGHAEIIALEAAASKQDNWRLENCILYVTLEPCLMCTGAIIQSRIAQVIFGAYDLKEGAMGSKYNLLANTKIKVIAGILENDCSLLLKQFFKSRRNNQ